MNLMVCQNVLAFEIEKGRVAPLQIQAGPDQTAHLTKTGHYPVVAMPPKTVLEFDRRLSVAEFDLSADEGSPYYGWTLLRIELNSSRYITGDVLFDMTYGDLKLVDNAAKKTVVKLDVMGEATISSSPSKHYLSVFPVALSSGSISVDYILRSPDKGKTIILTHRIGVNRPLFRAGEVSVLSERLPDSPGNDWSVAERKDRSEECRNLVMDIVRRCNIASCQVTFTSHLDSIGFVAFNEDFYKSSPVREKHLIRPIDMQSIYQACSISKVPCGYIYTKMASDGEVDLDTPLYKYYPNLLNRFKPQYREQVKLITGRMALSHTSGCGAGYINVGLDYYPDYHYNYRNSNTVALQWTIEYLKGKPLDEVAQDYIYSKCNMPNSRYTWQPQYDSLAVYGWTGNTPMIRPAKWEKNDQGQADKDFWWEKDGFNNNASFHFRTNSTEFNRFWRYYLYGADLKEDIFNDMIDYGAHVAKSIALEKGSMHHALVLVVEEHDELGTIIMHTGHNGDFRSYAVTFLDMNATLTLFVNCRHIYDINNPIVNVFLHNTQPLSAHGWIAGAPVPHWRYFSDDKPAVNDSEPSFEITDGRVGASQLHEAAVPTEVEPLLSRARFDVSTEKGSKYSKWILKRIVLTAPEAVSGQVRFHPKRNDVMLVDNSAKGNSISLEITDGRKLGSKASTYLMDVFPANVNSGRIVLDYYLTNGKETEILSHEFSVTEPLFRKGAESVFREELPKTPDGKKWSAKPFTRNLGEIKASVESVISKKRANLTNMQLAYSDNLGGFSMTVSNGSGEKKYDDSTIYQAGETGALPFVYAVMKLVEQGRLDLDKPLSDYYPGFKNHFPSKSREKADLMTARQCLSHTSGIVNGEELNTKTISTPGALYIDSRNNYRALQIAVEHITGMDAESLCQKYVFKPLGMKNTTYKKTAESKTNVGASLRTTASDFSKFLQWAAAGAGLRQETLNLLYGHYAHIPATEFRREKMNLWRGLGWIVEENAELGTVLSLSGRNGTSSSTVIVLPESNRTLCYYTDTANRINYSDALCDIFFAPKEPLSSFGCGYLYPLDNRL